METLSAELTRLGDALSGGDRRALARAITLAESTLARDRLGVEALLQYLAAANGRPPSIRLGISGVPGVGKSTFIEAFGLLLVEAGHRVAVLAVDPSSKRGGGSILGDKTRMGALAASPHAFIRPSPAGTTLGGVARRTREAILLCESAGFDVVLVETVGVGQSETAVADLTDLFLLLLLPGGGDDLQGIKRGIVELADLILVNKADGDLAPAAMRAVADYAAALQLMRTEGGSPALVMAVSALTGAGLVESWAAVQRHQSAALASGAWLARRREQSRAAFRADLAEALLDGLRRQPDLAALLAQLEQAVIEDGTPPSVAVRMVVEAVFSSGLQNFR